MDPGPSVGYILYIPWILKVSRKVILTVRFEKLTKMFFSEFDIFSKGMVPFIYCTILAKCIPNIVLHRLTSVP
jgi:hypothetical protein